MPFLTEFTLMALGLAGTAQTSHALPAGPANQKVLEKKVLTLEGAM